MGSETLRIITADELAEHKKPSDLWISIQGKVYDVTHWVKDHPGGEIPLLNLAGQDATDAFIAYHPASAWAHLDRFYVGQFADYRVSPVSKDFRRLNAEFSKLGLFEKKGHGVFLSLIFVLLLFSASVAGVLATDSPLVHLLSAALLGFVWIQSGWVGHDSGHYNVMLTPRLNRFAQILTGNCLTGISIGWWIRNHTAHHVACNSLDYDPRPPAPPHVLHLRQVLRLPHLLVLQQEDGLRRRREVLRQHPALDLLPRNVLRSRQPLRAVVHPPALRQEGARPVAGDRRRNDLLDLVPAARLVSSQLGGEDHVRARQLLRHRAPARPVHAQPLLGQRLCRPAHGQRLVREADGGHGRHRLPPLDGLVPRRAPVPGRASSVPEAAEVPPEEDLAHRQGALQEARPAVPERPLHRGQQEDDRGAEERRAAGPRLEQTGA
ncbi:delta(8)-fatty-acid desaturase 2-like [Iris pallida]|uniref:Delta(8)-fatty-acid desaturase 2-like n=1 Tax=Iris pallida TaxID=29817 RepID=A0AAX6F9K6_IRIPA|nr:delta(8)-fatty-acid desaturase 2-like [Iris pallida]